jgi:hypothetical protein
MLEKMKECVNCTTGEKTLFIDMPGDNCDNFKRLGDAIFDQRRLFCENCALGHKHYQYRIYEVVREETEKW